MGSRSRLLCLARRSLDLGDRFVLEGVTDGIPEPLDRVVVQWNQFDPIAEFADTVPFTVFLTDLVWDDDPASTRSLITATYYWRT